jgi:hypothetical protein
MTQSPVPYATGRSCDSRAARHRVNARRLGLCLLALGACVWLLAATTALAARSPDPAERAAIERAARRDQAYRQYPIKVAVSDIEVSTVGPWATAAVVVRAKENAAVLQELQEVYHRAQRGWIGSENPHISNHEIPAKVKRDLGFSSPSGSSELLWVKIVVWVVMAFGALVILAGIAWLLSLVGGQGTTYSPPARFSTPQRVDSEPWRPPQAKKRVPCPGGCHAGRRACPRCGWQRAVQDPTTSVYVTCKTCGGQLFPCNTCHGAGWIEV